MAIMRFVSCMAGPFLGLEFGNTGLPLLPSL
jgi:hypothetical protein